MDAPGGCPLGGRAGLSFEQLSLGLLFLALAFCACLLPAQADTYWHLRAGGELWASGRVPLVESFSYTAAGRPWPNHEWLWQAIAFGVFRAGGMPLLTLAAALIVTLANVVVWRLLTGPMRRRLLLFAAGMPLSAAVWALRPQVMSLLFLALTVLALRRGRFWLWPPLFVLWANLHGAVALGVVVVGIAAAVALVSSPRRGWPVAVAALLAALGTLATPLGAGLWTFIAESIGRSSEVAINEWRPLSLTEVEGVWFAVLAGALVVLALRRWRSLADARERALVVTALAFIPLAARHGRNVAPFVVVALPALALLWPPGGRPASPAGEEHPRAHLAALAVALAVACGAVAWAYSKPIERLGWQPLSPAAIAAVRGCPERLYNRYDDGGFLTFFVPERLVFIDSRQDPYPRELVVAHVRDEATGHYDATFRRWRIGCAFLPPGSPTAHALAAAGWHPRHRDDRWVVLGRPAQ